MVNSKKNTKSIIALVVLSLLLIASICLAATGAWFTANVADKSDTVKFGKIEMAVDGGTFHVEGGNINDMLHSLNKIKKYNRDIIIYPGHGEHTTLGYEINNNIYFRDNIDSL